MWPTNVISRILIVIKNSARILGESSRNQVPLPALQMACAKAVPDLSVGEVESLVVSLIDQGYIRGYLLHGRQLL